MAQGIPPQPGSSIAPEHFVGRQDATAWVVERLNRGSDLVLSDPRRMGKTAWLDALSLMGVPYEVVKIDYEGVQTTEEFLLRTAEGISRHQTLPGRVRSQLNALFENLDGEFSAFGIKLRAGVEGASRTRLLEQVIDSVEQHSCERPTLVAMDEVPIAILNIVQREGADAAHVILQTLRSLRGRTKRVRWLLCGSVGFHHVLRAAGATQGVINDLVDVPFGPLDRADAVELAERLLVGIGRTGGPGASEALADRTDGIAFLMHAVGAVIEMAARSGPVTTGEVEAAWDDFVHRRDESRAMTHLLARVDDYYGALAPFARSILDAASLSADGVAVDVDLSRDDRNALVDLLLDDHYVTEASDGRLLWKYRALCDVWIARRRLR